MNVAELREYCSFDEERVYLLMAIARAKDNDGTTGGSEPVIRKIVDDADQLERKVDELAHAVGRFDERFRLYISANARNATKAVFQLRRQMDDWLEMRLNGNEEIVEKFKQVDSEFKSVLQSDGCKDETNFVFDLDDASAADLDAMESALEGFTTITTTRSTPNGYHVVTDPFDYNQLETDADYELKTDAMLFVSFLED